MYGLMTKASLSFKCILKYELEWPLYCLNACSTFYMYNSKL